MEPQQDQQAPNQVPPSEPPVQPEQPEQSFQQDIQPAQPVEQLQTQPVQQIEPVLPTQPLETVQPIESNDTVPQTNLFPGSTTAPIQTPQPIQPIQPGVMPPTPPVKKSKKGLLIGIIAGSVVVLGLAGAFLWYFLVYNNPTNVVLDAFSKVLAAKSSSSEGAISIKSSDVSADIAIKSATNEALHQSVDAEVKVTLSGQTFKLNAQAVGNTDELYIRLNDLRSVIASLGADYSAIFEAYYGSLLDKIDSKWVVIKTTDIDTLNGDAGNKNQSSKEIKCVEDEMAKLNKDASLRNELIDVYKANPLFTVESRGSDANGNIYRLTPVSSSEAKKFFTAVAKTKFVAALDDCVSENLADSIATIASGTDSTTSSDAYIDLWINGWSHTMNKVAFSGKGSGVESSMEFNIKLNNNPTVTIPKADTTFTDLKAEIDKLQQQLTQTYDYPTDYGDDMPLYY